jgi:hypothetical protein
MEGPIGLSFNFKINKIMAKKVMGPGPKKSVMPGQKLKEAATTALAAKKLVSDKKKAAELKAAKMMVGTAATKNKPVLNTKKVVIKAKYPR